MSVQERVAGWDLLRGLCALAVAAYHLLHWLDVTSLHSWGSYGVYMFFVLSGASLAYTYAPHAREGRFAFGGFLWLRYVRLAPLYLLLVPVALPWMVPGAAWDTAFVVRLAQNASFLFGLAQPATSSLLVGGWSLGIEAVFYLLFPLLLPAALRPRLRWLVLAALLGLQLAWIAHTVGTPAGYAQGAVAYHHPPAFAAYFFAGLLIGVARRDQSETHGLGHQAMMGGLAVGFVLLLALNPAHQGGELTGWHGALFAPMCVAMVWLSGQLRTAAPQPALSAPLGDATYGLYLLHPVLFFSLTFQIFPRVGLADPAGWNLPARLLFAAAVGSAAFVLALLSERYIERPLRRLSRRLLDGKGAYRDASSISS